MGIVRIIKNDPIDVCGERGGVENKKDLWQHLKKKVVSEMESYYMLKKRLQKQIWSNI